MRRKDDVEKTKQFAIIWKSYEGLRYLLCLLFLSQLLFPFTSESEVGGKRERERKRKRERKRRREIRPTEIEGLLLGPWHRGPKHIPPAAYLEARQVTA